MASSLSASAGIAILKRIRWSLMCLGAGWGNIEKPMDPRWLDVLLDPAFKTSMREVRDLSSLDTARLANLWQWCGMSEEGVMLEVGAFRGGTSLHLSNRWPRRRIFACDTFDGFATLTLRAEFDIGVPRGSWRNPDADQVKELFSRRGRDAVVLKGTFPGSDADGRIRDVSFVHIDVDIYESCRTSLEYLSGRATPSAIFVVNDYLRQRTRGIRHAVDEFVAAHREWMVIPAYPGQGIVFNRVSWGARREGRELMAMDPACPVERADPLRV